MANFMVTQTHEDYKTKKRLGIALRRYLMSDFPSKELAFYVGLKKADFHGFIESQLRPGMTFDNYGEAWIIDHVVPLFLFDHARPEETEVAWNYANLVPMPAMLNRLKGVSVEFSAKELALRSKVFPDSTAIPALNSRLKEFAEWMDQCVSDEATLRSATAHLTHC